MNLCVTEEKVVKRPGQESSRQRPEKKRRGLKSVLQTKAADILYFVLQDCERSTNI